MSTEKESTTISWSTDKSPTPSTTTESKTEFTIATLTGIGTLKWEDITSYLNNLLSFKSDHDKSNSINGYDSFNNNDNSAEEVKDKKKSIFSKGLSLTNIYNSSTVSNNFTIIKNLILSHPILSITTFSICLYSFYKLFLLKSLTPITKIPNLDKDLNTKTLENKFIIITGANKGIGLSLTKQCLYLGATIIMAVRNIELGLKQRDLLIKEISNNYKINNYKYYMSKIHVFECDLSNLSSIKDFISCLQIKFSKNKNIGVVDVKHLHNNLQQHNLQQNNLQSGVQSLQNNLQQQQNNKNYSSHLGGIHSKILNTENISPLKDLSGNLIIKKQLCNPLIDFVICNAGMMNDYDVSKNGIEIHFATNYLGHYYLINLLLKEGLLHNNVRIINLVTELNFLKESENTTNINNNYNNNYNNSNLQLYSFLERDLYGKCQHFTIQELYKRSKYALLLFTKKLQEEANFYLFEKQKEEQERKLQQELQELKEMKEKEELNRGFREKELLIASNAMLGEAATSSSIASVNNNNATSFGKNNKNTMMDRTASLVLMSPSVGLKSVEKTGTEEQLLLSEEEEENNYDDFNPSKRRMSTSDTDNSGNYSTTSPFDTTAASSSNRPSCSFTGCSSTDNNQCCATICCFPENIKVMAVYPGATKTSNFKKISWSTKLLTMPLQWLYLQTPEEGCKTILYCMLEKDENLKGGAYYQDCKLFDTLNAQEEDQFKVLYDANDLERNLVLEKNVNLEKEWKDELHGLEELSVTEWQREQLWNVSKKIIANFEQR
ncbi:hypothetical protein ABK040_003835 [Willaertia magna]